MESVSLNRILMPRSEAFIPVDDRGFLFGDGVFETILVRDGIPYLFARHLTRLNRGLEILRIGYDSHMLEQDTVALIQKNGVKDGVVRITITRGPGSNGYLPYPELSGTAPTALITTRALPQTPPEEINLTIARIRRIPGSALPTDAKLLQGINPMLARMEAVKSDCFESILLDVRGYLSECSSHNLFWSRGRTLFTPHTGTGCLAGVMRQRVMDLSGFKVREGYFTIRDLLKAEAVLLTNSTGLVLPVHGLPDTGTVWKNSDKLAKIYMMSLEQDIASDVAASRIRYRTQGWVD